MTLLLVKKGGGWRFNPCMADSKGTDDHFMRTFFPQLMIRTYLVSSTSIYSQACPNPSRLSNRVNVKSTPEKGVCR